MPIPPSRPNIPERSLLTPLRRRARDLIKIADWLTTCGPWDPAPSTSDQITGETHIPPAPWHTAGLYSIKSELGDPA